MNDLLQGVRGGRLYDEDIEAGEIDVGYINPDAIRFEEEMQPFFDEVERIKRTLEEMRQFNKEIDQMHEKSLTMVKSPQIKAHKEAMQKKIGIVSTLAQTVKAKIETLDKENETMKQKKKRFEGSAGERSRSTLIASLRKKLKENMVEFTSLRERIQKDYKETIDRRIYTITGQKVSEEEIERIVENGEGDEIFQKAIMEQGRGRVMDTYAEIQERNAGVKEIEQSLLELHQIFVDMAMLVEAQGEMLDNIEKQVGRSVEFVRDGAVALQQAKEYQKSGRKWLCIGLIIVCIIAVVIVLAVVQPWKFIH